MSSSTYNSKLFVFNKSFQQLRFYASPIHCNDSVTSARTSSRASNAFKRQLSSLSSVSPSPDYLRHIDEKKKKSVSCSRSRTVNSIYNIARSNNWEYFITLTFDPKKLDSTNYEIVSKTMSKWLSNLRSYYCPDLVYLVVPELHHDGKKWHFHALFSNCSNLPLVDSGRRDRKGRVIYNLGSYHWGFSTATPVTSTFAASSYLTKYITKELVSASPGRKRYWVSRNAKRPEVISAYISPEDKLNLLVSNGSNIKYYKSIGSDDLTIEYAELSDSADILNNFLIDHRYDGFVTCYVDFDDLDSFPLD